jgi:hypothetical protein
MLDIPPAQTKRLTMNSEEILEKLLEHLSKPAPLPVAIDLWDTKMIGAYLKRSLDTVRDDIVTLPSFPRPIRLPLKSGAQHTRCTRQGK